MRGANLSSNVGLQAGSELSERTPADKSLVEISPAEREQKHIAASTEISITGTTVGAFHRSRRLFANQHSLHK